MVRTLHIVIAIVAIFVAIYIIGAAVGTSTGCITISEFKQCWKMTPDYVNSEFCTAQSCLAQPEDQQHNAIVSTLLDACTKAKNSGYSDQQLVSRIEEVALGFIGYEISAEQLCDQPGTILAYRSYE